jgi:hypothetical protein
MISSFVTNCHRPSKQHSVIMKSTLNRIMQTTL